MSAAQDLSRPLSSRLGNDANVEKTLARADGAAKTRVSPNCPSDRFTAGGLCYMPTANGHLWSATRFRSGSGYVSFSEKQRN
tara:strand:- start:1186 stop:1431 length:246 start_codon:yes stop_codon:yes gene_type:complete